MENISTLVGFEMGRVSNNYLEITCASVINANKAKICQQVTELLFVMIAGHFHHGSCAFFSYLLVTNNFQNRFAYNQSSA